MLRTLVAMSVLALAPAARSATLVVPSPTYPSIALALAAATTGDVVSIKAGTYTQPISLLSATGVVVRGKGKVVIEASSLQNGIVLTLCNDCTIENVTVRHSLADGVLMIAGSGNRLSKVRVEEAAGHGIVAGTSSTLSLTQCKVKAAAGMGFSLATTGSSIAKCSVDGAATGFRLDGARNAISGLTIANCTDDGLVLGAASTAVANVLENVKVVHASNMGLHVGAFADGNSIRNVTITFGDTSTGVFVESGAEFNRLVAVRVTNHGNMAFAIAGDFNVLQSFVATGTSGDGFRVLGAASGNLFVDGWVKKSTNGGFSVFGSGNSFVRNQSIQNGVGQFFHDPGATNEYLDNGFPEP